MTERLLWFLSVRFWTFGVVTSFRATNPPEGTEARFQTVVPAYPAEANSNSSDG